MTKFTIVATGYNCANYVEPFVKSIKAQTISDWRCVIVDDGSTDYTLRTIEAATDGDDRFTVVNSPDNMGAAFSRFIGAHLLHSDVMDVLIFADLDDELLPNALQVIKEAYRDDTVLFTFGNWQDHKGRRNKNKLEIEHNDYRNHRMVWTHLRTMRYAVFSAIDDKQFMDAKGNWIKTATDVPLGVCAMEIAGQHGYKIIQDAIYKYTLDRVGGSLWRYGKGSKVEVHNHFSSLPKIIDIHIYAHMATYDKRYLWASEVCKTISKQVRELHVYDNSGSFNCNISNVIIHRGEDYGCKGKFHQHWQNGYHLMIDDDIDYPDDYAIKTVEHIERYERNAVIAYHGRTIKGKALSFHRDKTYSDYYHFNRKTHNDVFIHTLGTGVSAYHTDTLRLCRTQLRQAPNDDINLGILMQQKKVPIICPAKPAKWINPIKGYTEKGSIYDTYRNNDEQITELVNSIDWRTFNTTKSKEMFTGKKWKAKDDSIHRSANVGGKHIRYVDATDEEAELIMSYPLLYAGFEYTPEYVEFVDSQKKTPETQPQELTASYTSILTEALSEEAPQSESLPPLDIPVKKRTAKPRKGRK